MTFSHTQVAALYIGIAIASVAITDRLATTGVKELEQATRVQCITHDWPADKAAATSKWCVANGYRIN